MGAHLEAHDRTRLANILGMLGSEHSGERAAAGLMASRLLRDRRLTWHDVVGAPPAPPGTSWRALVAACQCEPDKLTAWEAEFLASLTVSTWSTLTDKQSAALQKIADRVLRS